MTAKNASAARDGFSLLEMSVALGISGILFGAIWQLTASVGQQREVAGIVTQATAVTAAAQNYIGNNRLTLLALPQLAALNNVARIKLMSGDTGHTADSVQGAGFLPQSFVNTNSYGQTYVLYVQRQDGGIIGSIDNNDKLIGLLVTNGGTIIPDAQGAKISSSMGAAGGFMFASENPAPPSAATTARGSNGGWSIDLASTGWSGIGTMAQAGRLSILVNLLPSGGSGASVGPSALDDLDDARTNYTSLYNMYLGQNAGQMNVLGAYNTGLGYGALQNAAPTGSVSNNTALGYNAARGNDSGSVTGSYNVAVGANALMNFQSASRNTAIGVEADYNNLAFNDRTSIGYRAGYLCAGSGVTFIGAWAGACINGAVDTTGSTLVGSNVGRFSAGVYNTLVGAFIGGTSGQTGNYNNALGYRALANISATGEYNVALGHQAGANITDGDNNIMIGAGSTADSATGSWQLNIGDTIYGNMQTGQLNIGSATMASNVTLDVGSRTDSMRATVGTNAQRPTCDTTTLGAMRWNSERSNFEYCASTGWTNTITGNGESPPPTPTEEIGYFVLSSVPHDADFGGKYGADTFCLNDLQSNDWRGKADAVSRGLLTINNVTAFLASTTGYGNPMPITRYYFARSGSPASGGADFLTDWAGQGPGWPNTWAGYNYFDGSYDYWIGSRNYSDNYFGVNGCCNSYCDNWTNNSAGVVTGKGSAAEYGYNRYRGSANCAQQLYLICIVNP